MPKLLLQLALGRCHVVWLFFLNFLLNWVEEGGISCIPGWPWAFYTAEDDLKLGGSPATSQELGLQVCLYPRVLWHWGSNRNLLHVGKHCTIWSPSPGPAFWTRSPLLLWWSTTSPGVGNKAKKLQDARRQVPSLLTSVYLVSLPVSFTLFLGSRNTFLSYACLVCLSWLPVPPLTQHQSLLKEWILKWKLHDLSGRREAALAHIPIAVKQKTSTTVRLCPYHRSRL